MKKDAAVIPMSKEILDVINAVVSYGKFISSHNYIVPKENFDHVAEMEKYYHSLPLPDGMSKNRADFEKILQIGWYSEKELERLNNTQQSELQNVSWKPKEMNKQNNEKNINKNIADIKIKTKPINTRPVAGEICELFEELLDRFDITIPNDDEIAASGERIYGSNYDALKDGIIICLNDFVRHSKYAIAKEVDLENFKNALECIDYNPEDYTKAELQDMFDTHSDKLANDETYNAIYNEALEEVLKEYEKAKETSLEKTINKAKHICQATNKGEVEKVDIDIEI